MVCDLTDPLVQKLCTLYKKMSKLDSLSPSKEFDALHEELVTTIKSPQPIDVTNLSDGVKLLRNNLIILWGIAEGLREKHYAKILATFENPIDHLGMFPMYSEHLNLSRVEHKLIMLHCSDPPSCVAFVGSGAFPGTTIAMATQHLTSATFHNYDIDASANSMASKLIAPHPDLSKRMKFKTADIMNVSGNVLKQYDLVCLASLVGVERKLKLRVIEHLAENMAPGALLMLRSADGARAFLYQVVEPCDLPGFEVLSVYHPTNEFLNSIIVARKCLKNSPLN